MPCTCDREASAQERQHSTADHTAGRRGRTAEGVESQPTKCWRGFDLARRSRVGATPFGFSSNGKPKLTTQPNPSDNPVLHLTVYTLLMQDVLA